jgi:hypothetical protein
VCVLRRVIVEPSRWMKSHGRRCYKYVGWRGNVPGDIVGIRLADGGSSHAHDHPSVITGVTLGPSVSSAETHMHGRDIGCTKADSGRARVICEAIAASMEWTWLGHAVISPGYRPTFDSARKVYCHLKINKDDVAILQKLKTDGVAGDWRLESGANDLLQLVDNNKVNDGSVFSPQNPNYILKDGCP